MAGERFVQRFLGVQGRASVGFLVAYGISANTRACWDTQAAWDRLGYAPQDNSETFAPQVEHLLQPEGPMRQLQGGLFLGIGPFEN